MAATRIIKTSQPTLHPHYGATATLEVDPGNVYHNTSEDSCLLQQIAETFNGLIRSIFGQRRFGLDVENMRRASSTPLLGNTPSLEDISDASPSDATDSEAETCMDTISVRRVQETNTLPHRYSKLIFGDNTCLYTASLEPGVRFNYPPLPQQPPCPMRQRTVTPWANHPKGHSRLELSDKADQAPIRRRYSGTPPGKWPSPLPK